MNAEIIQSAFTGLIQLLVHSTRTLNEITGCTNEHSAGPLARLKQCPTTGEMIPKTDDELTKEKEESARRRRTARWCFGIIMATLFYLRFLRRKDQLTESLIREFSSSIPRSGDRSRPHFERTQGRINNSESMPSVPQQLIPQRTNDLPPAISDSIHTQPK